MLCYWAANGYFLMHQLGQCSIANVQAKVAAIRYYSATKPCTLASAGYPLLSACPSAVITFISCCIPVFNNYWYCCCIVLLQYKCATFGCKEMFYME